MELPRTANGKIDRQLLRQLPASLERRASTATNGPQEPTMEVLRALWTAALGHSNFTPDDSFFHVGGDSLRAFQLLLLIEDRFRVRLPPHVLREQSTLRKLASGVDFARSAPAAGGPQIVPLPSNGDKSPVIFVHPANRSAEMYYRVAEALRLERPSYGIHAPPVSETRPGMTIEAIAARYLERVRPLLSGARDSGAKGVFAGFSVGGTIAYEMARQLAVSGGPTVSVVMIDISANHGARRSPWRLAVDAAANLPNFVIHDALRASSRDLIRRGVGIVRKSWRDTLSSKRQNENKEIRPAATHGEARHILLTALDRYYPRPYAGTVILARAAAHGIFASRDPAMGWADLASDLRLASLPGSHTTCLTNRLADSAEVLRPYFEALE
jgi:thioesterase domain-containing protein/acyl carrier protein